MSSSKNNIGKNISALYASQIASYVFPFITIPYLARILGPEFLGLIGFCKAITLILMNLADYGFILTATRNISITRYDKPARNQIYYSTQSAKLFLSIVCLFIFLIITAMTPILRRHLLLSWIVFISVPASSLTPVWFFLGMESMHVISLIEIFSSIISTLLIFIFIHHAAQYNLAAFFQILYWVLSAIAGNYLLHKKYNLFPKLTSFSCIRRELASGWHVFVSTIYSNIFVNINTVIVGIFCGSMIVGYYNSAEKIVRQGQSLLGPPTKAIFPHIASLAAASHTNALHMIRKTLLLLGGIAFLISLLLFLFAHWIVLLILGGQFRNSVILLKILSAIPFVVVISNILGIQTMLNFGFKEPFQRVLMCGCIFHLLLLYPAVHFWGADGVAALLLLTETVVCLSMLSYLYHKDVRVFGRFQ